MSGFTPNKDSRVDTHIHALPPPYVEALRAASDDPSAAPEWSLEDTIQSMNRVNTEIAILSLPVPGVPLLGTGQEARDLARAANAYFGHITTETTESKRLGYFGVLPDWQDLDGTLAELDFLYTQQKLCFGVTVYTTYGNKLLGDTEFIPIWQRLQQYKALVFIHPGEVEISPKLIASTLPQSVVDYPVATTRTAVDLVVSQTLRRCPDVDIILSHAGGVMPFLLPRIFESLAMSNIADATHYDATMAREDFSRFYYDIAMSTGAAQLHSLLDFANPSQIIFGSDFPFLPDHSFNSFINQYNEFVESDQRGHLVAAPRLRENALQLLRKHAQGDSIIS